MISFEVAYQIVNELSEDDRERLFNAFQKPVKAKKKKQVVPKEIQNYMLRAQRTNARKNKK